MIKIDWLLYFRHRCILGWYLRRDFDSIRDDEEPRLPPWRFMWKWNWQVGADKRPIPWHRTWNWDAWRTKQHD